MQDLSHLKPALLALATQRLNYNGAGLSLCLTDSTGVPLLSIAGDTTKPAASTIKIAVLLAVLRQVDAGELTMTDMVAINAVNRVGGTGVLMGLPSVTQLSLQELCQLMMVVSDNTATNQLIDVVGFDAVERFAGCAGLTKTALRRKMMDAQARAAGLDNTSSAIDLCRMMHWILQPGHLSESMQAFVLEVMATDRHQSLLAAALPAGVTASNKVGQLPDLRNDVGIFSRGDQSMILAVMATGFSDPVTREGLYGGRGEQLLADIGALLCQKCL